MKYEVRFQISGEEQAVAIEAEDAASAAARTREEFSSAGDAFELIQVHLLDDTSEHGLAGAITVDA